MFSIKNVTAIDAQERDDLNRARAELDSTPKREELEIRRLGVVGATLLFALLLAALTARFRPTPVRATRPESPAPVLQRTLASSMRLRSWSSVTVTTWQTAARSSRRTASPVYTPNALASLRQPAPVAARGAVVVDCAGLERYRGRYVRLSPFSDGTRLQAFVLCLRPFMPTGGPSSSS
jgi:hypothetical protein